MFAFTLSQFHRTLLYTALVAGTTMATSIASASTSDDNVRSLTVQYADLDPANVEDAGELYRRLQAASRSVCRPLKGRDLSSVQRYNECYDKALGDAVYAINERNLTALHNRPAERTVRSNRAATIDGA